MSKTPMETARGLRELIEQRIDGRGDVLLHRRRDATRTMQLALERRSSEDPEPDSFALSDFDSMRSLPRSLPSRVRISGGAAA